MKRGEAGRIRTRWKEEKRKQMMDQMEWIQGGVTAATGFLAAGAAAGVKYQGRKDMALIYSETPCVAAGVFTGNLEIGRASCRERV